LTKKGDVRIDTDEIAKALLSTSKYIKEAEVVLKNGEPFAVMYPDFELLKDAGIVNIEEELEWYGVELYNIDAQQGKKIKGYEIVTRPLSLQAAKAAGLEKHESEPDDEVYRILKKYLHRKTLVVLSFQHFVYRSILMHEEQLNL